MLQKQPGNSYLTFGDCNEDFTRITCSGRGIVINRETKEVTLFGDATKLVSKARNVSVSTGETPVNPKVNNQKAMPGRWEWTEGLNLSLGGTLNGTLSRLQPGSGPSLEGTFSAPTSSSGVFSLLEQNTITLEADCAGYVVFESVGSLILVDFQFSVESRTYASKVKKGYDNVWFNGLCYKAGTDLFDITFDTKLGKEHDIITLKPDFTRTEQFYVEYSTSGKVIDFDLDKVDFGKQQYAGIQPDVDSIIQHFRCSWLGEDKVKGSLSIKRASGDIENVPLVMEQVDATVLKAQRIVMPFYHRNQVLSIDFASFGNVLKLADDKNKPLDLAQLIYLRSATDPKKNSVRVFNVQLENNVLFTATVYSVLVPYVEEKAPKVLYFSQTLRDVTLPSSQAYMLNGRIYNIAQPRLGSYPCAQESLNEPCAEQVEVSADKSAVKFNFDPSVESIGTYKQGVWSIIDCRIVPLFNEEYTYNVFASDKHDVNMNDFGVKSRNSTITWHVMKEDGSSKQLKEPKLTIDVPENTVPGGLVKVLKVKVVVDVFEAEFTVSFVLESFARINFLVPGDDNFGSSSGGSMRKRNFANKFTFGNFLQPFEKPLLAYNVSIDENGDADDIFCGKATLLYPVVKFLVDNLGTLVCSKRTYPVVTGVVGKDVVLDETDCFNKLNNCNDLVLGKKSITVPSTTGTCFFKLGEKVYLFKPEFSRATTFSLGSRNSSAASSAANTPVGNDDLVPPPPAPVVHQAARVQPSAVQGQVVAMRPASQTNAFRQPVPVVASVAALARPVAVAQNIPYAAVKPSVVSAYVSRGTKPMVAYPPHARRMDEGH